MAPPKWLNRVFIDAIHLDQLREHGGHRGMRNEPALTAALESPNKRWEEEDKPDLARLAATYGHDIATDRPYRDGNTRVAFLAMAAFLEMNGRTVVASEEEVLLTMIALSEGQISRKKLATWIRERLTPD
ncbi:MAG: type II toxin-antitoxin system death-on-curing family toxin [Gemmatimonadaceae bacterium]